MAWTQRELISLDAHLMQLLQIHHTRHIGIGELTEYIPPNLESK